MAGNVWAWCSDWYRADAYIGRKSVTAEVDPKRWTKIGLVFATGKRVLPWGFPRGGPPKIAKPHKAPAFVHLTGVTCSCSAGAVARFAQRRRSTPPPAFCDPAIDGGTAGIGAGF
jgi:hypothetical protein